MPGVRRTLGRLRGGDARGGPDPPPCAAQLNSTMLGARRPVNGETESPVVVGASSVCAALAGAVRMHCPSLVRAGKGPGVAAPPSLS